MSMRRSRIQVKPNLGSRGPKPGERASGRSADKSTLGTKSPDVKTTSPVKGQDKPSSPVKTHQTATPPFKRQDKPNSPVRVPPQSTPPTSVKPSSPRILVQNEISQKAEHGVSPRTRRRSILEKGSEVEMPASPSELPSLPEGDIAPQECASEVKKALKGSVIQDKSVVEDMVSHVAPDKSQTVASTDVEPVESVIDKVIEGKSDKEGDAVRDMNTVPQLASSGDARSSTNEQDDGGALTDKIEKLKPRPRGRYGNRAKPNLSEAGRPRSRQNAQNTKPIVETKQSVNPEVEERPASDLGRTIHSDDIRSAFESGVSVPTVGVEPGARGETVEVEVAGEEMVAAGEEAVIPEEEARVREREADDQEVFIPAILSAKPQKVHHPTTVVTEKPAVITELEEETKGQRVTASKTEVAKVKKKPVRIQAPADQPPDKFKMKMKDLIYWNPSNNPMKIIDKKKKSDEAETAGPSPQGKLNEEVEPATADMEEEESLPVPQVKIGPDGSIILNEESLVINNRPNDPSELMSDINIVDETDSLITYASFRQRRLCKNWGDKETERFFWALSVVGTDFSLMSNLFKRRSRHDLKKKFKREEKHNRILVDKALLERNTFDMAAFENVTDEDEEEVKPKRKPKKERVKKEKSNRGKRGGTASKQMIQTETDDHGKEGKTVKPRRKNNRTKKPAKPRRKQGEYFDDPSEESSEEELELNSGVLLCDDGQDVAQPRMTVQLEEEEEEEEEDDDHKTLAKKDKGQSSDEEESRVLESMCQKTRSGRQPKRTSFYSTEGPGRKRVKTSSGDNTRQSGTVGLVSPGLTGMEAEVSETQAHGKSLVHRTPPVNPSPARDINQSIQTVQNIPNVGGGQLVLVTQKGAESQGQGTVIHVYMLSPTSNRTPDWPKPGHPGQSPRTETSKHVYSVSPRAISGQSPSTSTNTHNTPSSEVGVVASPGVHSANATTTSPQCVLGVSPLRTNTDVPGSSPRIRTYPLVKSPANINSYSVSPRGDICVDIPAPSPAPMRAEMGAIQCSNYPVSSLLTTGDELGQIQCVDIPSPIPETTSEVTSSEVIMDMHPASDDIASCILSLDPITEETVTTTESITTLEQAVMEAICSD